MLKDIQSACLIFPFSRTNGNAISSLIASLDTHPILKDLDIILPKLKKIPNDFPDKVNQYKSIILAFSVFTTQLDLVSKLIEKYRQLLNHKNLLVIAGGPHPNGDPFSMLYNGADVVCTGEGEEVIREIITEFLGNQNWYNIKGIAFFDKNKKLIRTSRGKPLCLDDFPPFSKKHNLIRPIEITRGCAFKCRFCQIRSRGGIPVRHRPVKQILEYVEFTVEYFSERRPDIRFISPNALSYGSPDGKSLRLDKVEELLSRIRDIIGPEGRIYFGSFPSEVRPETITEESAELLRKYSDSKTIILGGQSGSNRVLQTVDRGHNVAETERATQILINKGFNVDIDIIFGLPGETEEDVKATIKHMENLIEMGAKIHSHTFLPLVGTPFASEDAGEIHPLYQDFLNNSSKSRFVRGQHIKQEEEAAEIEQRRKREREIKYNFDTVRVD